MSAETIIEMAREVALRKRERALTAACLMFLAAEGNAGEELVALDAIEAAMELPCAPE